MNRVRDFICHGKKDRCLTLFGYRFPICSRCTGFYSGIGVGFLLYFLFFDFSAELLFIFSIISLLPLFIDGALQELTGYESTNVRRLFTGLVCGLFIGMDLAWILFFS